MPTSLIELLTATDRAATERQQLDRQSAAVALGHLGRALGALRDDGISRAPGDLRERQVAQLAASCRELAAAAPQQPHEPRCTALAGAMADAAISVGHDAVVEQRWAIASALTGLFEPLCRAITTPDLHDLASQRARQITQQAHRAQQTCALEPPTVQHNAVLDTPIPTRLDPTELSPHPPDEQLAQAVAILVNRTRRDAEPCTIAEVHAVSIAGQTITRAAAATLPNPAACEGATASWAAVRESLRPFHDGSRHLQRQQPLTAEAAREIYRVLTGRSVAEMRPAVADAAQHLPALAEALHRTMARGGGTYLALARDLPFREERLANVLAGNRPGGAVRADARDLVPVTTALTAARLASTALAADVGRDALPRASHTWAAHQEFMQRPDAPAQVREAQQQTLRQLQEQPRTRARPLPPALANALARAVKVGHDVTAQLAALPDGHMSPEQAQAAVYTVMDAYPDTIPPTPTASSADSSIPATSGRERQAAEATTDNKYQPPKHGQSPGR